MEITGITTVFIVTRITLPSAKTLAEANGGAEFRDKFSNVDKYISLSVSDWVSQVATIILNDTELQEGILFSLPYIMYLSDNLSLVYLYHLIYFSLGSSTKIEK